MGQPSPSRRRVPQACDRCRVKKGKCDGKKPVCTRCALDGQMCMFSERKFSKDRVIPKGYVELLENRVEVLETGLREALLRLNATGSFHLANSPTSNPPSPTAANFLDHSHDLNYNITQALKELQAMKSEREKGTYSDPEHDDHSDHDHDETSSRRDSGESTRAASSVKTEDLATPLTSPSHSPLPKTLFLPGDISQPLPQAPFPEQIPESTYNFYAYYERPTPNPILAGSNTAVYGYDEMGFTWLDPVALDDTYNIPLPSTDDFTLMNM